MNKPHLRGLGGPVEGLGQVRHHTQWREATRHPVACANHPGRSRRATTNVQVWTAGKRRGAVVPQDAAHGLQLLRRLSPCLRNGVVMDKLRRLFEKQDWNGLVRELIRKGMVEPRDDLERELEPALKSYGVAIKNRLPSTEQPSGFSVYWGWGAQQSIATVNYTRLYEVEAVVYPPSPLDNMPGGRTY